MIFHNGTHELRATKGYILVQDIENPFIKATDSDDIYMPEGTAFEEANEGQGIMVKIAEFSRLGVVVDLGNDDLAEDINLGDTVYYIAQAATHIPIGPASTIIRIPVGSILGIVTPIPKNDPSDVNIN